jgi:hypothetical protein
MNTLPRGINRRFHGICKALEEQAKDPAYTKERAKRDLLWLATTEGYPLVERHMKLRGKVHKWLEPDRWTGQSDANAMIAVTVAQVFCDERELYLYEYMEDANETPYRTVGGRSPEDMKKYIDELRSKGETEKARILSQVPRWTGRSWVFEDPAEKTPEEIIERTFKGNSLPDIY